MLHAVIMAGGFGTRFWPLSRTATPKQLLDFGGGRTMIQLALDRLAGLVPPERTLVITNRQLVEPIRQQLPELPAANIVGEPCKRDTAPCVGLAAHLVTAADKNATMLVMPADHLIEPVEKFRSAIQQANSLVQEHPQRIVTFGIRPNFPAETFGYIECGRPLPTKQAGEPPAYQVIRFREKPQRPQAEEFLAAGTFFWPSAWNSVLRRSPGAGVHRHRRQIGRLRRDGKAPRGLGNRGPLPLERRRELAITAAEPGKRRGRQHHRGKASRHPDYRQHRPDGWGPSRRHPGD
ncbi:MAG: NTP transferase domain-containing protein [Planctomycetales bacterium]|nr:NTP transferase domain-containing protein [Planctomycetales bacterium]